jgi:hypothetical protein
MAAALAWPGVFARGVTDGLRIFARTMWAEVRPAPDL